MTITLTVTGRIASVDATTHVVAGNTYPVTLSLDSEWTGSLYLRVRFGSLYYDIPFASSDTSVDVQMPVGYPEVGIGVFSEALEICTNETRVRLLRSILEQGVSVVEFDSDLYDQWAGEVTTLLTDDAFDAESDRPVKNSVITAWKDTVPIDSALVHKTGQETIGGNKIFTDQHVISSANTSIVRLRSALSSDANSWKAQVNIQDSINGSPGTMANLAWGSYPPGGYEFMECSVKKPDRSAGYALNIRAFSDHFSLVADPYYPVDGSGNPQALGASELMRSGNIAVDPRLVHTTGNETIAGAKTFTSKMEIRSSEVSPLNLKSTTPYGQGSTKSEISFIAPGPNGQDVTYGDIGLYQNVNGGVNLFGINARALDGSTRISAGLRCANDGATYWLVPSYRPVDSQGVHLAPPATATINSEMLAIDPRVVHTTGTETVAGVKTFAKPASLAMHEASSNNQWGWRKMLVSPSFSNQNDVNMAIFELTDNTGHHARFQLNGRNASLTGISMVFGNYDPANVKVSRDSNGEVIVWCRAYRTLATLVYEVHAGSNSVTFVDSGTTAIFDEPTTDTYAQVIQPSN